jgi:hypothetical protein
LRDAEDDLRPAAPKSFFDARLSARLSAFDAAREAMLEGEDDNGGGGGGIVPGCCGGGNDVWFPFPFPFAVKFA